MRNLFNSIPLKKPKTNTFNLSHDVKLTLEAGKLVPTLCMECVPGDSFQLGCESLVRMAPMLAPVLHRLDVYTHTFFVPNRILWDNWEKYITASDAAVVPAPPPIIHPFIELPNSDLLQNPTLRLADYFGINRTTDLGSGVGVKLKVNALPFAAYQRIVSEYYLDQNLSDVEELKAISQVSDGNNTNDELWMLRDRCWEHDYFTSALPWAQKGAQVDIPLGTVTLSDSWSETVNKPHFVEDDGTMNTGSVSQTLDGSGDYIVNVAGVPNAKAYDPDGTLEVEPTTINDLRRAFKLQEWLEKNARAGTRYVESILAHFGVRSSDARLNRPEYITGTKTPITISEVLNTSGAFDPSDPAVPSSPVQGNMAGHGISAQNGKYGKYFCEEHGFIITIMSILPKTSYQQGVPKQFLKFNDRFEYFWPEFANIGEQPIVNQELYNDQPLATRDGVFGYTPRYAEYKYMSSRVCGSFKHSLNYWHMGRIFDTELDAVLNENFVTANPTKRIFAVMEDNQDPYWVHTYHTILAKRRMPKYGVPSF